MLCCILYSTLCLFRLFGFLNFRERERESSTIRGQQLELKIKQKLLLSKTINGVKVANFSFELFHSKFQIQSLNFMLPFEIHYAARQTRKPFRLIEFVKRKIHPFSISLDISVLIPYFWYPLMSWFMELSIRLTNINYGRENAIWARWKGFQIKKDRLKTILMFVQFMVCRLSLPLGRTSEWSHRLKRLRNSRKKNSPLEAQFLGQSFCTI